LSQPPGQTRLSVAGLTASSRYYFFFFFAAFLAFLFLAIADLRQRLKEVKHGARPYRDGLFNRRKKSGRIEFLCLSTCGASGLEEKLVINMLQPAKKHVRRITHNLKSGKSFFDVVTSRSRPIFRFANATRAEFRFAKEKSAA
jgi:hypothetical protein